MKFTDVIARADQLLALGQETRRATYDMNTLTMVEGGKFHEFRSASLSFLRSVYGESHPHFREFDSKITDHRPRTVDEGIGMLRAARNEIAAGWLVTTRQLVSAEIFTDFVEMASYFLEENYKDPAAVIVGSVLEERLRQLAAAKGLPLTIVKDGRDVPKKAETLNTELTKAGVYTGLDQKSVTAWLDLRNKAAHGKYGEYTKEQVEVMLQGIVNFIARVSP